tara:strand:- start:192 stop:554 length:363 start_codon:yes stop_codon:yes gene_type:complete
VRRGGTCERAAPLAIVIRVRVILEHAWSSPALAAAAAALVALFPLVAPVGRIEQGHQVTYRRLVLRLLLQRIQLRTLLSLVVRILLLPTHKPHRVRASVALYLAHHTGVERPLRASLVLQ